MSHTDVVAAVRTRALNRATRTDQTDVVVPEIGRVLSDAEIRGIEHTFGLSLAETLRRIYCEVGDGGFGPGYGFLPMKNAKSKYEDSIVDLYTVFIGKNAEDPTWSWPEALVPVVDFGCAIRACVDCKTGKVVVSDPNLHESSWSETFLDQGCTLDDWLRRWCAGESLWERIYAAKTT